MYVLDPQPRVLKNGSIEGQISCFTGSGLATVGHFKINADGSINRISVTAISARLSEAQRIDARKGLQADTCAEWCGSQLCQARGCHNTQIVVDRAAA